MSFLLLEYNNKKERKQKEKREENNFIIIIIIIIIISVNISTFQLFNIERSIKRFSKVKFAVITFETAPFLGKAPHEQTRQRTLLYIYISLFLVYICICCYYS